MATKVATPSRRTGGTVALFATALPGVGSLLAKEITARQVGVVDAVGFDGRNDVVVFTARLDARVALDQLRLCEDIYVRLAHTRRRPGDRPGWVADRLCRDTSLHATTAVRAALGQSLRRRPTARAVVRLLAEVGFRRTDLRQAMTSTLARVRPRWRHADPADVELWVLEYQPGRLISGLRITNAATRQHSGRVTERAGALRPTIAAAMVRLAEAPGGTLLDPCCGAGTILTEARALGWETVGFDRDPTAAEVASTNAGHAVVAVADARCLPVARHRVAAYVSNLPFGKQFSVGADTGTWLRAVLTEAARVTRPDGRIVLLHPNIPRAVVPPELELLHRHPVRLLGTSATIWTYRRTVTEVARG